MGFSEESGTRSSLLWECEKAIRDKRPKYLLMENVKALVQKKFMPDFQRWIELLESYGYANFWQVLNAKDFGVAQNRERVFMVSILRTDSDLYSTYNFPKSFPLNKCVEDYMVDAETIDESYFIDQERVTNKVLSDILDQPNVRAEMEKLYHEEWEERISKGETSIVVEKRTRIIPKYRFKSAEFIRFKPGYGMGSDLLVYEITFYGDEEVNEELSKQGGESEYVMNISIDVYYKPQEKFRECIRKSVPNDIIIENYKEFEDAIYQDLIKNHTSAD